MYTRNLKKGNIKLNLLKPPKLYNTTYIQKYHIYLKILVKMETVKTPTNNTTKN